MSIGTTLKFLWNHPLSAGARPAALKRFLTWQLTSRLNPQAALMVPWINGIRLVVRRGETGVTGNLYCGLHEFHDMAFTAHLLRPGDLFFDAGANAGVFTLLACGVAGADGISVEPVPETYQRLHDHIALNRLSDRVSCVQAGLGAESGELRFTTGLDTINHVATASEAAPGSTIQVPIQTIDNLCAGRVPRLIKIDVEGYESFVLDGAAATLSSADLEAVIMEVNGSGERYGVSDQQLLQQMQDLGFVTVTYDPWTRSVATTTPTAHTEGNLIFVKQPQQIGDRCRAAPALSVFAHTV